MVLGLLSAPPRLKTQFQKRTPSSVRAEVQGRKLLLWSWALQGSVLEPVKWTEVVQMGWIPNRCIVGQHEAKEFIIMRLNWENEPAPLFTPPTPGRTFPLPDLTIPDTLREVNTLKRKEMYQKLESPDKSLQGGTFIYHLHRESGEKE